MIHPHEKGDIPIDGMPSAQRNKYHFRINSNTSEKNMKRKNGVKHIGRSASIPLSKDNYYQCGTQLIQNFSITHQNLIQKMKRDKSQTPSALMDYWFYIDCKFVIAKKSSTDINSFQKMIFFISQAYFFSP